MRACVRCTGLYMPVYRVYTGALWCNIGLYRAIPIMTSPKCVVKSRRVCVGLVFVFLAGLSMASMHRSLLLLLLLLMLLQLEAEDALSSASSSSMHGHLLRSSLPRPGIICSALNQRDAVSANGQVFWPLDDDRGFGTAECTLHMSWNQRFQLQVNDT